MLEPSGNVLLTERSPGVIAAFVLVFALTLSVAAESASARRSPRPRLAASSPAAVTPGGVMRVTGRVAHLPAHAVIALEERTKSRWRIRARGRAHSRFALPWHAPANGRVLVLRAVLLHGARVLTSSKTKRVGVVGVLAPSAVAGAPAPGRPGDVTIHGAYPVTRGGVIATGVGPSAPYGFLAKVTSVRKQGADTVLSTVPATLPGAVPDGALQAGVGYGPLRSASPPFSANLTQSVPCSGGGTADISGRITLSPAMAFRARWSWPHGTSSASFTGSIDADAQLTATASEAAGCALRRTPVARWALNPVEVRVGPVPVVLSPTITVFVSANGGITSTVTADVHGSLSATGALEYVDGDFRYVASTEPSLGSDPVVVEGNGHLGARVTPTFDLALYGVGGPEVSFMTGLELDASAWSLRAPVDLDAALDVLALGIASGPRRVRQDDILLDRATTQADRLASDGSAALPFGWAGVSDSMDALAGPADSAKEWDRMVTAGVESARVQFVWARSQVYPSYTAPGIANRDPLDFKPGVGGVPTDFLATDAIVRAAATRGIRLLPTVVGAPVWAAAPNRSADATGIPSDDRTYANYLRTLIRRYGPGGTFWSDNPALTPQPIRQWQIWNEPNISYFWGGVASAWSGSYVRLLKAAHDAVKQEDPGAKIVLAGLSDYNRARSWNALDAIYNNGVYSRETTRGLFDFAAEHPYSLLPEDVLKILQHNRDVMNENGDDRKPQMITELSWPSSKLEDGRDRARTGGSINVTEKEQAAKIRKMYPLLADARNALRLTNVFWYSWITKDQGNEGSFEYSGLNSYGTPESRAKPGFFAWAQVVRQLEGCRNAPKPSVGECG